MGGLVSAIFGGGGGSQQPYTPAPAPDRPTVQTTATQSMAPAADAQRKLAASASGLSSTIKTSATGAAPGQVALKSLLGE